jgi:hypothetical protein
VLYYPFQSNILNYASGSGVSDGTLSNGNNIYFKNSGGYREGVGCLYNSTFNVDNYFDLPLNTFVASKGCSIAFWYKANAQSGYLFKAFDKNTGDVLGMYNVGNGWLQFNSKTYYYLQTVTSDAWYHIVWVLPASGLSYIYQNGGEVNGGKTVLFNESHQTVNLTPTHMRLFQDIQPPYTHPGPIGYMNNFRLYNRSISQAEITALWKE